VVNPPAGAQYARLLTFSPAHPPAAEPQAGEGVGS
jgi:hypothetical protein